MNALAANRHGPRFAVLDIAEQMAIIAGRLDMQLSDKQLAEALKLKQDREGTLYAIPSIRYLKKRLRAEYKAIVNKLLRALQSVRNVQECVMKISEEDTLLTIAAENAYRDLEAESESPFLVISAQLGIARPSISADSLKCRPAEFPLDLAALLAILIAHPEHIGDPSGLGIICAGTRFRVATPNGILFAGVPHIIGSRSGAINIGRASSSMIYPNYGVATGFNTRTATKVQ